MHRYFAPTDDWSDEEVLDHRLLAMMEEPSLAYRHVLAYLGKAPEPVASTGCDEFGDLISYESVLEEMRFGGSGCGSFVAGTVQLGDQVLQFF